MLKIIMAAFLALNANMVMSHAFGDKNQSLIATETEINANSQQNQNSAPAMNARLKLQGKKFEQKVRVKYPITISLKDIRENALSGSLMKELSDWVTDAHYSWSRDIVTSFTLTVGKMGINYTHEFRCQENIEDFSWSIECEQNLGESKDGNKQVISGAKRSIRCEASGGLIDGTICDFEMSGAAAEVGLLMTSISAGEVAFTLFVEDTNYLAHLSLLLAAHGGSAAHVRSVFTKSVYKGLMEDLNSQAPNFKKMPPELIVASATEDDASMNFALLDPSFQARSSSAK